MMFCCYHLSVCWQA